MKRKTKTKPIKYSVIILIFVEILKMKVWNDNLLTLWHCNRDTKIMTIKSCDEFKIGLYTHSHPVC